MNSQVRIWAFFAVSAFCDIAQAGRPPTTPADARNVSGLETGDAGQSIKPPSGASVAPGTAVQNSDSASVWLGSFTVGSTTVILGPFFVCVVHTEPPLVSKPDDRR